MHAGHLREPLSRMPKEHLRRELSSAAREEIDLLAEGMTRSWKTQPPPSARIAGFVGRAFSSSFAPRSGRFMAAHLSGLPLLDLGAAEPADMIAFSSAHGVAAYIAVDRYFDYSGIQAKPGVHLVNEDMLRFLAHQPDNYANVCMNAIDDIVLMSPDMALEASYTARLMGEIARVVPPGGLAFGLSSPILHILGSLGFERVAIVHGEFVADAGAIYRKGGA